MSRLLLMITSISILLPAPIAADPGKVRDGGWFEKIFGSSDEDPTEEARLK